MGALATAYQHKQQPTPTTRQVAGVSRIQRSLPAAPCRSRQPPAKRHLPWYQPSKGSLVAPSKRGTKQPSLSLPQRRVPPNGTWRTAMPIPDSSDKPPLLHPTERPKGPFETTTPRKEGQGQTPNASRVIYRCPTHMSAYTSSPVLLCPFLVHPYLLDSRPRGKRPKAACISGFGPVVVCLFHVSQTQKNTPLILPQTPPPTCANVPNRHPSFWPLFISSPLPVPHAPPHTHTHSPPLRPTYSKARFATDIARLWVWPSQSQRKRRVRRSG
ncbi:hypothetical protein C369_07258 [Cryptococcus neoformans A5-35-17]|nr:hypothetical protein C369_07258 [Cryptococcus neoformans var. grubii A5-35-17]